MTIPSENKRNDGIGNGATDTYPYTFKITSESDIKVSRRDTDDVETPLTLNVDYTVTGVGALNGGSIVLTAGNLATDYHLTIRRDNDLTQLTDVRNQGDFFPEVHEDTFDKLASVSLTQQSEIDRSVKVSETYPDVSVELPGPQAGKVLKWNETGTALINVDTGDAQIAVPADDSVTPAKIQSGLPFVFPETLVLKRGSDVASASALPLVNDGNYSDVTGTNAITSMDSIGVGTWMLLRFNAALTLTHHATNLFLPAGGSNILTAAGDHALFVEYGIGAWRCVSYIKANGQPIVLTGITFTNPVLAAATLNTSVAGTAFQDDDSFASAAANKFASSESIKEYVDSRPLISQKVFSSSGTFTVPAGVTEVLITAVAGGGGGGGGAASPSANAGNGGGAGQAIIDYSVTGLTPGEDIEVTVGDGGAGGSSASDGTDGEDTVFTGHITVNGGGKGIRGLGGAGGSTAIGTAAGVGGSGGSGAADGTDGGEGLFGAGGVGGTDSGGSPGGGGGGGSIYDDGGAGGNAPAGAGSAANANSGAGGGGGSGAGGGAGGIGAAGGSGLLIVKW